MPRMTTLDAEVVGTTGSAVLLIPGGAATTRGFFPGVQRAFADHRVVFVDRPGTGRAVGQGVATLPGGATSLAVALEELGCAPAVVLAQSLGGAVAVQLAIDHPAVVAGLVLIDPTPFNDASVCRQARWTFELLAAPTRLPLLGRELEGVLWRRLAAKVTPADEEAAQALHVLMTSATLSDTGAAIRSLVAEGQALAKRLHPVDVPLVILTADRKPGHRVRRAHQQLAAALGGRVESWPGAIHAEHVRRPEQIIELVRGVLNEAAGQ
jgi:pimeloyl-ACP methyl ester carboxylesterase